MNYKILVVDDEPANINLLERIFSPHYDVIKAGSGQQGLEMLAHHDVSLIISDQRMPGMTGVEFLERSAELRPQCVRIILTGYTDTGSLIDAINSGVVYKFVTKPWVNADLQQTVKRGLSHFETLRAQNQLATNNLRLRQRIDETVEILVRVLMAAMNMTDPDAETRAAGVLEMALRIGRRLALDAFELNQLSLAAYLNEAADFYINASGIRDGGEINGSPRQQTVLDLLSEIPDLEETVESISYIDENYDGTGPYGMAGDQIPYNSRIIAIARALRKMDSDATAINELRPMDDLIDLIRGLAGKKFDPAILTAFNVPGLPSPVSSVSTIDGPAGTFRFPRGV